MIDITDVELKYGDKTVLQNLSLRLTEQRIGIVGSNGSGKSSFARLLNGLVLPDRGRVLVDGIDTKQNAKAVRRQVGFVFQNPDNQIVMPVVEEDLAFGLKNRGLSSAEKTAKIDAMLKHYDLDEHRNHPAHLLSGGQKQLLAIAGVLVMEPRYVVMDEPTTLLDLRNTMRISRAINALEQSAIIVTHNLDLLSDFDRVIVFDQGRVLADDTPSTALKTYITAMFHA